MAMCRWYGRINDCAAEPSGVFCAHAQAPTLRAMEGALSSRPFSILKSMLVHNVVCNKGQGLS